MRDIDTNKEILMKRLLPLALVLLGMAALVLSGCGEDSEAGSSSFEEIYQEEGVPVRTRNVETEEFRNFLTYHAVMTGIEQSSGYASITDQVEEVYVEVGDYVEKGQPIVGFPTDNPSARYHQARVSYENAKKSYERIEQLYEIGGVSRQELDNARTALEVAEADWNSVRESVQVTAPISGFVTKINVVQSDNVMPGDELFTISKTEDVKTTIWATDEEIQKIEEGAQATAEWNEETVQGRVVRVDMAKNQDRQAFGVVVEFENNPNSIRLGVMAEIRITTYRNPDAVVVETKDLVREGGSAYVFVARDGQAVRQQVTTGRRQGLMVEVTEGLSPGDTLIVEGQNMLDDGSKVKVITEG
jgi:RND family efflux transporter MFP subunit